MTKEKIINLLKKACYSIGMAVLIFLLFVTSCITIGATIKAVDIAYDNGGRFADYIDRIADTLNDNNYSKATKGIVANAATIGGVDYPPLTSEDLILDYSINGISGEFLLYSHGINFHTLYLGYLGDISFDPYAQYYLSLDFSDRSLFGYFSATDNLPNLNDNILVISSFTLSDSYIDDSTYITYTGYIVYLVEDDEYYLYIADTSADLSINSNYYVSIYSIPTNNTESTTTESLTDILGNSITFSTSAITTSVKEVFEGLFVNENNTISNYATYVVWFSGIAIALGFFKYILRFILTMGDKK